MKTSKSLIFFLTFLSLRSSGQNQDAETLKKLNREFLNAIVNRDTLAFGKILADDFLLINPGGVKRNKADNLAGILVPNQKVVSIEVDSVDVRLLSGDMGLVTAWTYNVVNTEKGKETFRICYMDVYMKRKNRWVAVAAHVTSLGSK